MKAILPLWAGMPAPELSEIAKMRLDSLSFFAFVFVVSAGLICVVWNAFRRDFPWLPWLSFWRSLGLTFLWGLAFVLVLTMISGARELLTPGAWKKQGWTYALAEEPVGGEEAVTLQSRRQKIDELRFSLWDHARKNGGQFPSTLDGAGFPRERWNVPGPSAMRYLYSVPNGNGVDRPLAWEPEVFGPQRLVLFRDGTIGTMDSAALERVVKGGE